MEHEDLSGKSRKGKPGWPVKRIALWGCAAPLGGLVALGVLAAIVGPPAPVPAPTVPQAVTAAKPPAPEHTLSADQPPPGNVAGQPAASPLDQLSSEDRQAFTGGKGFDAPTANISLPMLPEELAFFDDRDNERFEKAAIARFPEIARVRFRPSADIADDPETMTNYRRSFHLGMYYAERIKTAEGETLFHLITRCSASIDPLDSAELGYDGQISITYFPVFRESGTGETNELQILLTRTKGRVSARNQFFSTSVLSNRSYMRDHGISCAK